MSKKGRTHNSGKYKGGRFGEPGGPECSSYSDVPENEGTENQTIEIIFETIEEKLNNIVSGIIILKKDIDSWGEEFEKKIADHKRELEKLGKVGEDTVEKLAGKIINELHKGIKISISNWQNCAEIKIKELEETRQQLLNKTKDGVEGENYNKFADINAKIEKVIKDIEQIKEEVENSKKTWDKIITERFSDYLIKKGETEIAEILNDIEKLYEKRKNDGASSLFSQNGPGPKNLEDYIKNNVGFYKGLSKEKQKEIKMKCAEYEIELKKSSQKEKGEEEKLNNEINKFRERVRNINNINTLKNDLKILSDYDAEKLPSAEDDPSLSNEWLLESKKRILEFRIKELEFVGIKEEKEEEKREAESALETRPAGAEEEGVTAPEIEEKAGEKVSVEDKFGKLGIKKEDLEKIEGFNSLTIGQQLLILENLKQLTLGRVQEEAHGKYQKEMAGSQWGGRMWKVITKKYQIAKAEKEKAEEIYKGGIKIHKEVLQQLTNGMLGMGLEVKEKDGKLEIQYAGGFKNLTPEKQKIVDEFNDAANLFGGMPDEWKYKAASKNEQKSYKEIENRYEKAKISLLTLKKEKDGERGAALYINDIEGKIKINQFLNTHPGVEEQLKNIKDKNLWRQVMKDIVTERGIYATAGFLTRTFTISMIGLAGAPLAAAGLGGFLARKRAKEATRENIKAARKGEKGRAKELGGRLENAGDLASELKQLMDIINDKEEFSEEERGEAAKTLGAVINRIEKEINDGLVNYGMGAERLQNQYGLINNLFFSKTMMVVQENDDLQKHLNQFIEAKEGRMSKTQKKYLRDQMIRGAIISAGLATVGYAIRHFLFEGGVFKETPSTGGRPGGAELPKTGSGKGGSLSDVKEVPPTGKPVPAAPTGEEAPKALGVETGGTTSTPGAPAPEVVEIWGKTEVKSGESPLHLAKEIYIKHAQELGYKQEMGDMKQWAETASTRHIVGQYIKEHSDEFNDLIHNKGVPPENPAELDKWISKVPKGTFEEILHKKVPNLIYEGDTAEVDAKGDIRVFEAATSKPRIGHFEEIIKKPSAPVGETLSAADILKDAEWVKSGVEAVGGKPGAQWAMIDYPNDYKLRMVAIDADGNGAPEEIRILNENSEVIKSSILDSQKGENIEDFVARTKEESGILIKTRNLAFKNIVGDKITMAQAKEAGLNVFAKEDLSPAVKEKLTFWSGHANLLHTPDVAKEYFTLSEATKTDYKSFDFQDCFRRLPADFDGTQKEGFMEIHAGTNAQKEDGLIKLFGEEIRKSGSVDEKIEKFFTEKNDIFIIHDAYGKKGFDILITKDKIGVDGPGRWNWGVKGWFDDVRPAHDFNNLGIKTAKTMIENMSKELENRQPATLP